MSTKTKTLAKSLHTVTALARVAEHIHTQENGEISDDEALDIALRVLGYDGAADPYELRAKAKKALEA